MKIPQEITVQTLDHLGIIAGIVDEIGQAIANQSTAGTGQKRKSQCRSSSESHAFERTGFCIFTPVSTWTEIITQPSLMRLLRRYTTVVFNGCVIIYVSLLICLVSSLKAKLQNT